MIQITKQTHMDEEFLRTNNLETIVVLMKMAFFNDYFISQAIEGMREGLNFPRKQIRSAIEYKLGEPYVTIGKKHQVGQRLMYIGHPNMAPQAWRLADVAHYRVVIFAGGCSDVAREIIDWARAPYTDENFGKEVLY
jgi:hypothetical protein